MEQFAAENAPVCPAGRFYRQRTILLAQKIRRYGIAHKRRIPFLSPFILQKAFSFC